MYNLFVRPIVRHMEKEKASSIALRYFKIIGSIPVLRDIYRLLHKNRSFGIDRDVFGLHFYNPLGLGAGLDKKGELCATLEDLGFSFVEIGPLNATSTRSAIANIQEKPCEDILAACIINDLATSFSLIYDFCDFFVIDISEESGFEEILNPILETRLSYDVYRPVVVKLPEEITQPELETIVDFCLMNGIDGIEARNLEQIKLISGCSSGRMPIIANCHIKTPEQAARTLEAGAALIEVRTGLVTQGPKLVSRILKHLISLKKTTQPCQQKQESETSSEVPDSPSALQNPAPEDRSPIS